VCTLDMVKTLPGVRGSRDLVLLLVNLSSIAVLCVCVCVLASAGIIGGVVGAGAFFVLIVILVLIIYIVCWRKKRGPFRYVA